MKPTLKKVNNKNMTNYKRIAFGAWTLEVEPKRENTNKQRVIAHPTALAKGNGGYEYYTDLTKILSASFQKECSNRGIKINKTHLVLTEASSFEPAMIELVLDAFRRRLPETIKYK